MIFTRTNPKEKIFPHSNFLQYSIKQNSSRVWKDFNKGLNVIKPLLRWNLGNGDHILFWKDSWLENYCLDSLSIKHIPEDFQQHTVSYYC